ncbi:MAG: flagellar M-ring protein FliF [Gemmatimonadota bacterium]|nr:flagellar M-ring protein FliF [Gemmatimonadota bacterium]
MADALQDMLDRVGGRQRAMLLIVGVGVAAAIFVISKWATAPDWVPAFTNQPIETVGQMTDKLTAAGIGFKLDRGGSDILVSETDVARARVTLAQAGLPAAGRPGMELFDQPSWGMTDFTQRINYRRALEGELERTIGKMRGVQSAQVHLALHEQSTFRSQDKPSNASVVLKTGGAAPAPDVVLGIAHLVASSVDGVSPEHVTVLDDAGRLLSTPDDGSMASLTNAQLSTQREVEGYLQTKAEGLVNDIVGAGNARVRVSAALNFDKIERSSQLVDPEKQATSTEQRYEITPGAQGGAASSNVAMSYDNSKITENFQGAIGNIKKMSVAVLLNDRLIPPPPGAAPDVKPTYVARTPEEVARIESLIRGAVGADSTRGDVVTVVATHFDAAAVAPVEKEASGSIIATVQQFEKPGISLLAIAALLVVAMMLIKAIKSLPAAGRSSYAPLALSSGSGQSSGQFAHAAHDMAQVISNSAHQSQTYAPPLPEPLAFPEQNQTRGRVAATIAAKPDVSTRVVRAWLKEAV